MAVRDIFFLDSSLGTRLIRLLYCVALILIAAMVVLGVVRGIRIMSRPPMPRMAMAGQMAAGATAGTPAPNAAAPQSPQPGARPRHFPGRRFMMQRFRRPIPLGPFGLGPMPRNPLLGGLILIVMTLIRGCILVMVARVLAELGLAVLAMPRRSEI